MPEAVGSRSWPRCRITWWTSPDRAFAEHCPRCTYSQALAYGAIDAILGRGRLAGAARGTGPVPAGDPGRAGRFRQCRRTRRYARPLEAEAAAESAAVLHDRLALQDPAAAASIDPRNLRRLIRALEVIQHSGRPFSGPVRPEGRPASLADRGPGPAAHDACTPASTGGSTRCWKRGWRTSCVAAGPPVTVGSCRRCAAVGSGNGPPTSGRSTGPKCAARPA
ncbi:MAG: hypothetical protein IPL60_12825 [Ardenticatenia bacterium]|nr:hypothetical protein [Ardenticatenia bacterium]